MNQVSEILISYDAREDFSVFSDTWDANRTEMYLLKESIVKPLSTDVMVWDSIFHVLQISLPDWVGPCQNLWQDYYKLSEFLASKSINKPYKHIAITQHISKSREKYLAAIYQTNPSRIDHQWQLLGYDISDEFLLSGLMNCGYRDDEKIELQSHWAKFLNQFHLFSDLEVAIEFQKITDIRVPEHSPFSVYGIYRILPNS